MSNGMLDNSFTLGASIPKQLKKNKKKSAQSKKDDSNKGGDFMDRYCLAREKRKQDRKILTNVHPSSKRLFGSKLCENAFQ